MTHFPRHERNPLSNARGALIAGMSGVLAMLLMPCSGRAATDSAVEQLAIDGVPPAAVYRPIIARPGLHYPYAILGDFDGEGIPQAAYISMIPGTTTAGDDRFEVRFSRDRTWAIPLPGRNPVLIAEGDLNDDGADEFSVLQEPDNGCTYIIETYTRAAGEWRTLFGPFLLPTGCTLLTPMELDALVYREHGRVYHLRANPNDENLMDDSGMHIRFDRLFPVEATLD